MITEKIQTKKTNGSSAAEAVMVQCSLAVGAVNDPLEHEADALADKVMSMQELPTPATTGAGGIQRKCTDCEEEEKLQRKPLASFIQRKESSTGTVASEAVSNMINESKGGGNNMDSHTQSFMQSRFGADFCEVKIHTGGEAIQMNRELNAKAFTVGNDIYFNEGQYNPSSGEGKHLLAHELVHTVQQGSTNVNRKIQKISASQCSKDCAANDGVKPGVNSAKMMVHVDKESDFLTIPLKKENGEKSWPVGHAWVTLISSSGQYWTYGFWPKTGFDSSHPFKDVEGCVHHPDTLHKPSSTQEFDLTDAEFDKAKQAAIDICLARPSYNLYSNQCTSFTKQVLDAAGKAPIGGYSLFWDSPNALSGWMNGSKKTLGVGYDMPTGTFGNQSEGWSLDASYVHQFYSILGNKLRFQWLNQGSIGFSDKKPSYLCSAIQLEFKPQKLVYVPDIYVFGGVAGGLISPSSGTALDDPKRWGVGPSAGVGLNFNIQNSAYLGFEYSAIKNIVNDDPVLHSLSLKFGLMLQ